MTELALSVDRLTLEVAGRRIVDEISLSVGYNKIVGIVGESGSGKSQTALAIAGLTPNAIRQTNGMIDLAGNRIDATDKRTLRTLRGRKIAYVFQEPMTALNPILRIGRQMQDALCHARGIDATTAKHEAVKMLRQVGMVDPEKVYVSYPHQLSGGMRQRVLIAMAFACRPSLIVADEPTTALDVIVQAQILALLSRLTNEYACGVLFISHDLAVIRQICDQVNVMLEGQIVESGPTEQLLQNPGHDYTRQLVADMALGATN